MQASWCTFYSLTASSSMALFPRSVQVLGLSKGALSARAPQAQRYVNHMNREIEALEGAGAACQEDVLGHFGVKSTWRQRM